MPFVVDASIAICWLMPDEHGAEADVTLAKLASDPAVVPGIFWYEVRNALLVNERRRRLSVAETSNALSLLGMLPLSTDGAQDENVLVSLSRQHRLTVYDAAYLELAMRRGLELATLDSSLASAATAEGVPLFV